MSVLLMIDVLRLFRDLQKEEQLRIITLSDLMIKKTIFVESLDSILNKDIRFCKD